MGQSQSSGDAGRGSRGARELKTSYYVLLGIERNATEEDIKKAYRRKALELHPDRNYGNEEAATKTFAEIQAAHEVLSDPQERAWYDSHESAILRGDDLATDDAPPYEHGRVTTADDLARMLSKFNRNVEFSDAPAGFYGFVRETFEQLAKEEDIASSWENVEVPAYPTFGYKDDEYGRVVKHFYAAWSGFSTVKSFSWRDRYKLSDAPDRWIRRRMEQENLKLRKDGKQEFNDAVRSLVQFIKKRDPRFVPNTQSEAERQKALRDAAAAQAARARAANAAKLTEEAVPEWTKARDPEELEESSEEEVEELHFECVACNKVFKSERQWEAHEKSKKHQKAVKELQKRMRKQNAHLDLDESGTDRGVATPDAEDAEQEIVDHLAAEMEDHKAHAHNGVDDVEDDIENEAATHDVGDEASNGGPDKEAHTQHENTTVDLEVEKNEQENDEDSNSENDDYAPISTIQARMQSAALDRPASTAASTAASEDDSGPAKPKMGKAAQKRAKKAAAAEAQAAAGHKCQVCNEEFPSRTKLFQHVEEEGHAALKDAKPGNAKGKKGKSRR